MNLPLLIAGDVGKPNSTMDSGSAPMTVDDSGSGSNIPILVRKNARAHVPKRYFDVERMTCTDFSGCG